MYKPRATGHTQIIPESLSHRKMSFATEVYKSPSYSKMCPWGPTRYKLQKPNDVLLSDENTMLELPYDSAILLLGIYLEKTIIQKDTCTPMFTTTLFTTADTWKQPKRPSTEEWIKKTWHIHAMGYCSAVKGDEIKPFTATQVKLEMIIPSEVSQKEKDKYHVITSVCVI